MPVTAASVIILTWNGRQDIDACLAAVLAQTYPAYDVIVVDNASTDGTPEYISEMYPQVQLIWNKENLGFAAGNNIGLEVAKGDVLVLLNQDTIVESTWLAALIEPFAQDPQIGITGGKALYENGRIQHAGGYVNARGYGDHYGRDELDQGQFDQSGEVDFITGATLAISRPVYALIGGLDEGFERAYFEDVDWCYRARQAGFRVIYAPQAQLIHKEVSSLSENKFGQYYLFERNRIRFILKHWSRQRLIDDFLPAEQAWLTAQGPGSESQVASLYQVYLHHLLQLTTLFKTRQKQLAVPEDEIALIAQLLVALRTALPTYITETKLQDALVATSQEIFTELSQNWRIEPFAFQSSLPVLGRLIARIRAGWGAIAAKWYFNAMMTQQNKINAQQNHLNANLLALTMHQRQAMDFIQYITKNQWEISELAQEVHTLKQKLAQTQDANRE